ncbi:MAG TPA: LysR substrate-binding domain-containing protein [Chthoniobacterales bacterium]|nr:LysR substrate-binding domain-containing protein [Chthoniobacterales bacterium]
MELRHLRYFIAVAEALSFTKAAQKLHTSQPSLTRQVRSLEEELGVRLLNRNKQRVSLTEEGTAFLDNSKKLLAHAQEIVQSIRHQGHREIRPLNVGYVSNLFHDLLPGTLRTFRQQWPLVPLNLFDMSCGDQLSALETGMIDLAFVGLHEPIEKRGLRFRAIASYETVVALPKDDPLARKPAVDLKDLAPRFFIGMTELSYPGYHEWLVATCRRAGFTPKVLQDVALERTMIQTVAAGLGVALVPEQLKKLPHDNVIFRPTSRPIRTEGCVAWKGDDLSPSLQAYLEIVEQIARGE